MNKAILQRAFGDTKLLSEFCKEKIGKRRWRLTEDLVIWKKPYIIVIPKGFEWDGASVPFCFQWFCATDAYLIASCVHDWIYGYHFIITLGAAEGCNASADKTYYRVPKSYADAAFRELTHDIYNSSKIKSNLLYLSVYVGGVWAWSTGTCTFQCARFGKCSMRSGCPMLKTAGTPPEIKQLSQ